MFLLKSCFPSTLNHWEGMGKGVHNVCCMTGRKLFARSLSLSDRAEGKNKAL